MKAPGSWQAVQKWAKGKLLRARRLVWGFALFALVCWAGERRVFAQSPGARKPSQGQVAGQFLRAILRADYAVAYRHLAPEVRRAVSLERFEAAARPLWKSGQRYGQQIELYKLGVRLGAEGSSQLFYAFTFAGAPVATPPAAVLEVTYRDTAARTVLGFDLRTPRAVVPKRPSPRTGGTKK